MALSLAQKFINLGMASPLAVEFAAQLTAGVYNWRRLMWLGMIPGLAKYVADSLTANTFDPRIAVEKSMSEAVSVLTKTSATPPAPVYEPEAVALFARATTQPDTARKNAISSVFTSLKATGAMAGLDALYVLAAHDQQFSRLNWIADQYNLVATGGLTFTTDRGSTGNGVDGELSMNVNAQLLSKFKQDDAFFMLWPLTNNLIGGAISHDSGTTNTYIRRDTAASPLVRINSTTGFASDPTFIFPGCMAVHRSSSTAFSIWKNGVKIGDRTGASAAMDTTSMKIHRWGNGGAGNYGVNQIAAMSMGGTDVNLPSKVYTALAPYMAAVGAA